MKRKMDFRSLNRLNIFMNMLAASFLPVTNEKTKLPIPYKFYVIIVWLIEITYLITCIFGLFNTTRERALKDGTVNIVVSLEVIVLMIYLHNRKNLLRDLIGKLNSFLTADNEMLQRVTINTVKPLEKPLKIYTIANVSSLIAWSSLPLVEIFRKNEFYYADYQVPAVLSKEPFSNTAFVGGLVLQIFGSAYTIIRKISLDLYTMHLILLITAQYKYLRIKFATILRVGSNAAETSNDNMAWKNISDENDRMVKQEMKLVTRHYEVVVEMAVMLKKLLSPNIGILYINNVFRFCFLSFMFVMSTTDYFEKCLIIMYTIGALTQFYFLCFCIQQLLEASTKVADDAVYERWYMHDLSLQHVMAIIISTNKLECKLSGFRNINLTLPSFMSILNQAYSVCLLFLKARRT